MVGGRGRSSASKLKIWRQKRRQHQRAKIVRMGCRTDAFASGPNIQHSLSLESIRSVSFITPNQSRCPKLPTRPPNTYLHHERHFWEEYLIKLEPSTAYLLSREPGNRNDACENCDFTMRYQSQYTYGPPIYFIILHQCRHQ